MDNEKISLQVFVKITEVQNDDRGSVRINCSIRAVDQETGKDLDPENKLTARNRSYSLSCCTIFAQKSGKGHQTHLISLPQLRLTRSEERCGTPSWQIPVSLSA